MQHNIPPLPQPGASLTHEQAAFYAHLAGMYASSAAEQTSPAAAKEALLQAAACAAPRTPGQLHPLTVSMLWALEDLGTLFADIAARPLDDFALSYFLFADPEIAIAYIRDRQAQELLDAARRMIGGLTIPQVNAAKAHIEKEMSQLRDDAKKPSAATPPQPPLESAPSSPIAPLPQMDGPSPSSSFSSPNTVSISTAPSTASPSQQPSPCYPAEPSASASSARA